MINELYKTLPPITIPEGTNKEFTIPIECRPNYKIFGATDSADCVIKAKAAPGDGWTNIISGSLAIGSFAPGEKTFYFRIEIADGAINQDIISRIRVAKS